MSEPTTQAGRALLDEWNPDAEWLRLVVSVLAIEREAAAQERERIRAAIFARDYGEGDYAYPKDPTDAILAEPSDE